jgi:hypothetical protein
MFLIRTFDLDTLPGHDLPGRQKPAQAVAVKRREMLGDALIYVGVRRTGVALVTADIADYDYLQQALPGGQIVFFEALHPAPGR